MDLVMIDPMKSLEVLHKLGPQYAKAKAQRVQIEESLRSIKAIEMKKCGDMPVNAQEREAYASEAYTTAIAGLSAAVELEEGLRIKIKTAECALDVYRTMEASNRALDKRAA